MKFRKKVEVITTYDYLRILPYLDQIDEILIKKGIKGKDKKFNTKEENIKDFYEITNSLLKSNISKEEKELVRKILADYEDEKKRKEIEEEYIANFTQN